MCRCKWYKNGDLANFSPQNSSCSLSLYTAAVQPIIIIITYLQYDRKSRNALNISETN